MKKFGYTINRDRQIDYDRNDKSVRDHLLQKGPSLKVCLSCGSCSATCSAGHFTDFNIRRMLGMILRGEVSGIRTEIEKCMLCGKCQLVCPRGVNLRNLILKIHQILVVTYK
jgi:heterodisulfide reductase subunit C